MKSHVIILDTTGTTCTFYEIEKRNETIEESRQKQRRQTKEKTKNKNKEEKKRKKKRNKLSCPPPAGERWQTLEKEQHPGSCYWGNMGVTFVGFPILLGDFFSREGGGGGGWGDI